MRFALMDALLVPFLVVPSAWATVYTELPTESLETETAVELDLWGRIKETILAVLR